MRIRTVKPEFWTNETLAAMPEFTRLLALALLNYADDEGYFLAHASLIRGALFPFTEDSVSVHGALISLAEIDYIEIGEGDGGKLVGRIVNFEKHQRINRPNPSRIKGCFKITEDSVSAHGAFSDDSHTEQGTGNREQGTGNREQGTPRRASADEPVVVSAAGIQPAVEPPTSPAAPAEAPNPAETPGDAKKSRKPYVGAKNGAAHAHFISEWCAAYENDRGDKYKVTGGMDGKAVKGLLAFDPDVDELIATAQAAWQKSGPKFWHCERAVTITYFAARLNEIRAELAAPESIASGSRQSGQPQSTPVLMGREMKL